MSISRNEILTNDSFFVGSSKISRKQCERRFKFGTNEITKGSFGSIREACLKSRCPYIVKIVNIDFQNEHGVMSAKREAEIYQHLQKVAPIIHDHWECQGHYFIVMDRYDGDLRKYIQKNGLSKSELNQLRKLVDEMHLLGIQHNDLHTGNILYKKLPNGKVKFVVIDFGLSREKGKKVEPTEVFSGKSPDRWLPLFDNVQLIFSLYYDHGLTGNALEKWRKDTVNALKKEKQMRYLPEMDFKFRECCYPIESKRTIR